MKKVFIRLPASIVSFLLGFVFLILVSCGGGGGGGSSSSSSTPPPPDNFGSIMTAAPESAPGLVKEERESTEEYWTEERILEAVKNPMKMEEPPGTKIEISPQEKRQIQEGFPESFPPYNPDAEKKTKLPNEKINYRADQSKTSEATSSCPQLSYQMYSGRGYQEYPEKTMGVLIFQKKGVAYYCSASLIDNRMILTAAHCVSSDAAWHTKFLFIPGYNNGSNREPYGRFPASHVLVYSGWFNNQYDPADYAIIVLRDAIGEKLGWLGFDVNVSPVGKIWDQWGYPGEPVSDGMTLLMNRSEYGGEECSAGTPCRIMVGSGMVEGSSGGPWILWRDNQPYANSVTSQGSTLCNFAVSPYFDTHASNLFRTAQTAPTPTPTPTPTPAPPSEDLIGNFRFVYTIISTFTDRITLNNKSSLKTSEGTDVYTGYDADYPSVTYAGGAWYPSISQYIIISGPLYSSPYRRSYVFSINADNTLPGCYQISADSGATWGPCYSFILPASHKSPPGSWEMSLESQNNTIDINEAFEKRMAEDLEVQAQRTESASPVDADVISKINELTAIMDRNR